MVDSSSSSLDQRSIVKWVDSLDAAQRLRVVKEAFDSYNAPSIVPHLKLLLRLSGKPYTLDDHFMFEFLYSRQVPLELTVQSGRQVAKSTNLAAVSICQTISMPHHKMLIVTPLFEQCRRLSSNYFGPMIENCPIATLIKSGPIARQSILQRTFWNEAIQYFSFASTSVERTRGISVSQIKYDEYQGMDPEFIPIINESASASTWGGGGGHISRYGTPLSSHNLMNQTYRKGSMAEWIVPCYRCGYKNIPCLEFDLDAMIGPFHQDISEATPGTICAKCRRPVSPRNGWWEHRKKELIGIHESYHIPQIILPLHYASKNNWYKIIAKQSGAGNMRISQFYNEVCGEACDQGSVLVSITDLQRAAVLGENKLERANEVDVNKYVDIVLAVDWGGGGKKQTSFTAYAVLGMLANGSIEVIFGYRSLRLNDAYNDSRTCAELMKRFRCTKLVHDYGGAGVLRDQILVGGGFPIEIIYPVRLVPHTSGPIMKLGAGGDLLEDERLYYSLDKSRSLATTCEALKSQIIRTFAYDYKGAEQPGLLHDFLSLLEEKEETIPGSDTYRIIRDESQHDDFAQAVNIGTHMLWELHGWPNLATAGLTRFEVSQDVLDAILPPKPQWGFE